MRNSTRYWTRAAIIAALYVALTLLASVLGLASGVIQVRISEALTILPVFTQAAVPGLTAGCLLANLMTGCAPWDVIFGTLATFLGAIGTRALRNRPVLATLPPILSNTLIVPFVLSRVYGVPDSIPYLMLTVGIGEFISCGVLGFCTQRALRPHADKLFR
ncbi:MAG: QueT transporter family protein [Clostridia bacterium]|nr:QueT transporter family protein [Clostridia bacterium]